MEPLAEREKMGVEESVIGNHGKEGEVRWKLFCRCAANLSWAHNSMS